MGRQYIISLQHVGFINDFEFSIIKWHGLGWPRVIACVRVNRCQLNSCENQKMCHFYLCRWRIVYDGSENSKWTLRTHKIYVCLDGGDCMAWNGCVQYIVRPQFYNRWHVCQLHENLWLLFCWVLENFHAPRTSMGLAWAQPKNGTRGRIEWQLRHVQFYDVECLGWHANREEDTI